MRRLRLCSRRAITKKLEPALARPKAFSLVPAMIGDLGSLSQALARYYEVPELRAEPSLRKVLEQAEHTSRANDAALHAWLMEFIRTGEPWSAPEAALVAEKLGIDFAAEWNRDTDIDEAAWCDDMTPDQLRKIRGRYLPGLRPQDLPALLK